MTTPLSTFRAQDMVRELMNRGVLRYYGHSEYVPGIVRLRYEGNKEAFDQARRARQIRQMARALVENSIVSETVRPAPDKDAPPGDQVYEIGVLTIDPAFDFEGE